MKFPLAMFSTGRHMKRGKKFLGSVNMPHTLNKASWYGHKKEITKATDSVATTSKLKAADEARQAQGRDITVSTDGTWQRKGFASKNGVVTVLTVRLWTHTCCLTTVMSLSQLMFISIEGPDIQEYNCLQALQRWWE